MKKKTFLLALLPFLLGCSSKIPSKTDYSSTIDETAYLNEPEKNVLFIGNSMTFYYDMYLMFRDIGRTCNYNFNVEQISSGGASLTLFTDGGQFTNQVNDALASTQYDYVFIQELNKQIVLDNDCFYRCVRTLTSRIHASNPEAEVILYETWGYGNGAPFYEENPMDESEMSDLIFESYAEIANELNLKISHVGKAVEEFRANHKEVAIVDGDFTHPTQRGSYLIALMHLAAVTGIDPRTTTYVPERNNRPVAKGTDVETIKNVAYEVTFNE